MKAGIRKRKRKTGYHYTVYVDYGIVNNHRKIDYLKTFDNKPIAEKYKNEIQSQIDNNMFIHTSNINFSQAIDEWMENYVKNECEPNTYENYKVINEAYLKPYLGHYPLSVIGGFTGIDIINDYFYFLRYEQIKKNLSYSSVKHHKAQISGVLSYFLKNKKLKTNICINTIIPKDNKKDIVITNNDLIDENDFEVLEDKKILTPEQAVIILNLFMNEAILPVVAFAMFLGLRRSESLGILKSKINKKERKVIINAVAVRSGTKNIFKKKNKNKTSTRELYLPEILLTILDLYEERQKVNKQIFKEKYIESKFLCVMDNGIPIKPNYASDRFKKILDDFIAAEKSKNKDFKFPHVTLHTLRHFDITALLEHGAYIQDVQAAAGHAHITTTNHYTHNYITNKKQIADKTDEIFKDLIGIS